MRISNGKIERRWRASPGSPRKESSIRGLLPLLTNAGVYKWVDANGQTPFWRSSTGSGRMRRKMPVFVRISSGW
nr:DUF4124 domain-containing protein [Marinobacter subterrani]